MTPSTDEIHKYIRDNLKVDLVNSPLWGYSCRTHIEVRLWLGDELISSQSIDIKEAE